MANNNQQHANAKHAIAERRKFLYGYFDKHSTLIQKACAKHLTPERMIRIALTAASRNTALLKCSPESFLGALIDCSQLGLEPIASLGHAYLIPYRNKGKYEVQMQIGYKGLIALAMRSKIVKSIKAGIICERDRLTMIEGTNEKFELTYSLSEDRGKTIGAFAVAHIGEGIPPQWRVVGLKEIKEARDRSKDYLRWVNEGRPEDRLPIWQQHFDSMAMKTAIRRLSATLPQCPELQAAAQVDELRDIGVNASYSDMFGGNVIDIEDDNRDYLPPEYPSEATDSINNESQADRLTSATIRND